MPQITVMFWNIQNFGNSNVFKSSYDPLCDFIARVVRLAQADILCVQEVKAFGAEDSVKRLHRALCGLDPPFNNWYYDLVKGSIDDSDDRGASRPWARAIDLDWDAAHHEGYAVFWNQNLAKFRVNAAPPVEHPTGAVPTAANTQSEGVRTRADFNLGGIIFPNFGVHPPNGIVVPNDPAYVLPQGTSSPNAAIVNAGNNATLVTAGGPALGADTPVTSGTVLPAGTVVGAGGVRLTADFQGRPPVVVPAGFTLTDALTLPAPATMLVHPHVLSLVLTGRDTQGDAPRPATYVGDISDATYHFAPNGHNDWRYLYFPRGAGQTASLRGPRRPAYVIIDVNRAGGAAQRLVPIIVYHAPSAAPASTSGMQRAAYSRPLYQAYDPATHAWINNQRAVLGGDMNVALRSVNYAYWSFTYPFDEGGAACQIRADHPGPPPHGDPADPRNKSTAQLHRPPTSPNTIFSANLDDFRALAIDNVFYRGFGHGEAPVPQPAEIYDLLRAVTGQAGGHTVPDAQVEAFLTLPALDAHWNDLWFPTTPPRTDLPVLRPVQVPRSFVSNMAAGSFAASANGNDTPARRAAEFVHLCVSDHLPVLFTMNL